MNTKYVCDLTTAGSNSMHRRKTYPKNFEKSSKIGIFGKVRQSIDTVLRITVKNTGKSETPDCNKNNTTFLPEPPGTDNGWLSYFTQQTRRTRSARSESRFHSTKNVEHKRKIRRIYVGEGRTANKAAAHTKEYRPAARYLAFRRSISLPGDEIGKQQFNFKRSMSSREGLGTSSMNHASPSQEERIMEQTKDFCRDYIVQKLKRSNLIHRVKIERPAGNDQGMMREIHSICIELERRNPNSCKNLSKQLGITLRSEEVLRKTFFEFSREILMTDVCSEKKSTMRSSTARFEEDQIDKVLQITWGRIMAVLVVAGAFSIDCIKQGHSELVSELIEICGDFFNEEGVVDWIMNQSGWETLLEVNSIKTRTIDTTNAWNVLIVSVCVFASLALGVGISNLTVVEV